MYLTMFTLEPGTKFCLNLSNSYGDENMARNRNDPVIVPFCYALLAENSYKVLDERTSTLVSSIPLPSRKISIPAA